MTAGGLGIRSTYGVHFRAVAKGQGGARPFAFFINLISRVQSVREGLASE